MPMLLAGCGPQPQSIALVGSDTTVGVMGNLANYYNTHTGNGQPNVHSDTVTNVPPVIPPGNFPVPGDNQCGSFNYNNPSNLPPNGSSAGITALTGDGTNCNVDMARSSRGRSGSDPSTIDFYAYAIDAVSWAHYSGGNAPSNLTLAQLQGIYLCTNAGNPTFTNWNQVGGNNAPIVRYLPQTGSGTLSFFETKILGLSSAQQGVLDDSSCNVHPIRIEENSGNQVAVGDRPNAIEPYSFANWTAQSNGVSPDIRAGAVLGGINGVAPSTTTISNGTFFGRRYVYSDKSLAAAIDFAGVESTHNGFLCNGNGTVGFTLLAYGFTPLPMAPAGPGLPSSSCRKNPTPL
jgi:phosphate transport system substrate-binding protein